MSKIGFKRSPTTSTRPGTAKRARPAPAPAYAALAPDQSPFGPSRRASSPAGTAPSHEKLAELHAAAFCALRSAVEANDDGLVRRMREWEDRYARRRSSPAAAPAPNRRRRRRQAPSTSTDMQLARSLPLPPDEEADEDDDDDDEQLIIHTSPGAGLASCPPRPAPMAVDCCPPPPAAAWASAPLPQFTDPFSARRIAADPSAAGRPPHNYVAYRNSSSCTSSSDDEDSADADMVWASSSPYLSATTTPSSDVDDDLDDRHARDDRHVAELGFAFAAGCGAIQDYSVDAILALQAAGPGR